ncbi:alpha-farnesene synthase-like [Gossypium hirsutum]|uniref:Alpha-farnesene synthase-like n=1 Tax=Gossypium hirsutum TaxID=3635 RepID=A0ABM2YXU1_GOSHI|nr:alpha-farnesene synthase-like [Gossypium hirsutum]
MECNKQVQVVDDEQQVVSCHLKSASFDEIQQRRSANYKPNIWQYDFLQSLPSIYDGVEYKLRAESLKENVKDIFVEAKDQLAKLELIDIIRKLGLGDLFAEETHKALQTVVSSMKNNKNGEEEELYMTALRFKLLRLHGYDISQDVFNAVSITKCSDIKGLLELFEASYLAFEGETILDEAKAFSMEALRNVYPTLDLNLAKEVAHALELPMHWRVQWFDVKWRITMYETYNKNIDKRFLELAKLNFNTVQAILQKDLRTNRHWLNIGDWDMLGTQTANLKHINYINLFAFRWDSSKTLDLPECMKTCFQALYDITNEIASDIQELNGWQVQALLHMRKAWIGFCKALFVEAKWYNKGYSPSLEEYLSNALISSGAIVISIHTMLSVGSTDEKIINLLGKDEDLVYNISIITRLYNDLGTSMAEKERGDAPSSIHCYMREMNVSEKEAEEHIKSMINNTWKKINGQCLKNQSHNLLPCSFVKVTTNVARMVQCLYQFGLVMGSAFKTKRLETISFLF